jgi:predicted lysophospholipase L1 biosynthesis ABC-type transport system permease subunit
MALGAQRETLTAMFVRQGLRLTMIGAACGLVTAFLTMRLMSSLLFHVSPADPITYITITLGVVAVAYLACYLPSRRAATVEPMDALRTEKPYPKKKVPERRARLQHCRTKPDLTRTLRVCVRTRICEFSPAGTAELSPGR